ncbi:hypothetical protein [Blastococcus sp. Marseille-P5729]|uniref:hypothetical protein n=1 Tax=Blastococcus sp. Marseille-P5729 TaxID=2086582 RepID=UPI00131EBB81|nr:hypothetical protein [Blastococcus sp. Marseille-P5729]
MARPSMDAETAMLADRIGEHLGLDAEDLTALAVEQLAAHLPEDGEQVSAAALAELRALALRQWVDLQDLEPAGSLPTLIYRLGGWVAEPSGPTDPIQRKGFGAQPGQTDMALAPSVRGYHKVRDAGECRVIALRRGIPVLHGWADNWQSFGASGRRFAKTFRVAVGDEWVDADSGKTTPFDAEDQRIQQMINGLYVVTRGASRNPISWRSPSGEAS